MKPSPSLRALLFGLALFVVLALAVPPPAAAAPLAVDPAFTAWLITPPPAPICPGDQVLITIFVQNTVTNLPAAGFPVNIIQGNPQLGVTDPISKVVTNGVVSFVYKAYDNGLFKGTQTDTLTFNTGGYPTGLTVPVTINDCRTYEFNLFISELKEEDGIQLYQFFSGEGSMERVTGQAHGTGTSKVFLSIYGGGGPILCALQPPLQGSGVMEADATFNPVGPGVTSVAVDFTFERIPIQPGTLKCAVPGVDMKAEVPFDPPPWDADELGLQGLNLTLNNGVGSTPVSSENMTGLLYIWRTVTP